MMSGATPARAQAKSGPVRPNPVSTSSAMSSTCALLQHSASARRVCSGHMRMPPEPRSSGSTITAASSVPRWSMSARSAATVSPSVGSGSRSTGHSRSAKRIGERAARADAHGAEGIAVVRVLDGGDERPRLAVVAPELERGFDGDFDGGGSVVGKEDSC